MLTGLVLVTACSTQKNTSASRWWHSFNARYNTYYNGSLAYIDGSLEKEEGNVDNYTELIPLYTVGNKNSRELGKGNFDRAIEKAQKAIHQHSIKRRPVWNKNRRKTAKDIEWLNRREYNPFLWKAWMLMGRSQFHQGAFEDAASTFAYMSRLYATQPAIYGKARAWLAKSYIEAGWLYDAEDVIRNMRRDSMDWRAVKEWDYTYADYYLHTGELEKAVPYLRKVIRHEMRRKQKAREWYLMGQIQAALGHRDSAYSAFSHVIRMNPPYQLEFNARIARTEVMAKGQSKKMIGQLRRMASSDNNKDYLDQVYYAIGNIYLADKDTLHAISAYEEGNQKATRNGIEKGVLLLHLGDLYWAKEKFSDAKRCYDEAIGLLDKDRKDYKQLSERSKLLDELVPYTEAVQLQDSLQALAKMSEQDRNSAIDRVIEALKKKEKEEKRAQDELAAKQAQESNGGMENMNPAGVGQGTNQQQNAAWYFYNPLAVSQGKAAFQRQWGKRENVDNWQRANKTVVGNLDEAENDNGVANDSLQQAADAQEAQREVAENPQTNPHRREYYLAQIPFTPEQLQASNLLLEDGLFHSGVIFKDKMENLRLSEKALRRLSDHYPDYEHMDEVYYHLFLLYSRQGKTSLAENWLNKLKREYPKSQYTTLLADPYYAENARIGVHMEDSLYAATYDAFKADRTSEVRRNVSLSERRFPMGANRDKFLFIGGLSKLNAGDADGCLSDMKKLVEQYPESKLSEMAGMIINGVNQGRRLRGGKFDMGSVWSRRSAVMNDSDSIAARQFSIDRDAKFVFMLVYAPDSVNENQLLYELARYNFTNFLVRNFHIDIEDDNGLHRMRVNGFRNFDEALQYARLLHSQTTILQRLQGGRSMIISEPNLDMLGNPFSYDDYDKFYAKHFAPLKVSTFRLLTEPEEIVTRRQPEPTVEEVDRALDNDLYIEVKPELEPQNKGIYILPDDSGEKKPQQGTTVVPDAKASQKTQKPTGTDVQLPKETPRTQGGIDVVIPQDTTKTKKGTDIVLPVKAQPATVGKSKVKTTVKPAAPAAKPTQSKKTVKPTQKKERTGIYFNDGFGLEPNDSVKSSKKKTVKKKETKKKKFDLEDEYYDLEGF